MRKLLILILFLLSAGSYAQPVPVEVRRLEGYFYAGASFGIKDGVNYIVINNRKQFEKYFGNINRADSPNFAKEWMLLMLMPESRKESVLKFNRVSMKAGEFIEVYCSLDLYKHKLTYKYYPLAACVIPRFSNIHKVHFYEEKGMRALATLEVK